MSAVDSAVPPPLGCWVVTHSASLSDWDMSIGYRGGMSTARKARSAQPETAPQPETAAETKAETKAEREAEGWTSAHRKATDEEARALASMLRMRILRVCLHEPHTNKEI